MLEVDSCEQLRDLSVVQLVRADERLAWVAQLLGVSATDSAQR